MKKIFLASLLGAAMVAGPAMADNHGDKKAYKDKADLENLVTITVNNDNFNTLEAALKAADLVETVQSAEGITIFAPTDEAFANLPEGALDELLLPENKEKLQGVLTYHVVGSKIKSKDIPEGTTELETLQGTTLTVTNVDGVVKVDDATVTSVDIKGSNGVIHVIDAVVMP